MGKILNWNELKEAVDRLKADGKKIVFTNGCFDIIHIGHIRYLKEAKALGGVLVVGLNSDRSVSGIKPNRPINSKNKRPFNFRANSEDKKTVKGPVSISMA